MTLVCLCADINMIYKHKYISAIYIWCVYNTAGIKYGYCSHLIMYVCVCVCVCVCV